MILFRSYRALAVALLCASASAQSPAPSAAPAPTGQQLVDSLTPNDLITAISLLKKNFTNPDVISETELNRATIEGLMERLGGGFLLLPDKNTAAPASFPCFGEVLENHVGYVRPGAFTTTNLQTLDKKLTDFAGKKVDALIIDLRASEGNDYDVAAEFTKRFTAKGKTLFALRKQGKQDRAFISDRDPSYHGLIALLADIDTAGAAEAFVSSLRFYDKALTIGQTTAGRAVQYSDSALPSGKILRVAVSEVTGPGGESLYPQGIKADLPVEMSVFSKRQIFQTSSEKGMTAFIYDTERPHLNEAALMAGTNPELESAEQKRGRAQDRSLPRDAVLQRALDLITSLEVYQKR